MALLAPDTDGAPVQLHDSLGDGHAHAGAFECALGHESAERLEKSIGVGRIEADAVVDNGNVTLARVVIEFTEDLDLGGYPRPAVLQDAGRDDHITKPINVGDLQRMLDNWSVRSNPDRGVLATGPAPESVG